MHRSLTHHGALVVAIAVLAAAAMAGPAQRMMLRPGAYKLSSTGSTTKIPARCIDMERPPPEVHDTLGAGSANIRVKRTLNGKTEEFRFDDASQFFEAVGDGTTYGVDVRPRPEYRHYEFEIVVPRNEVSIVGASAVDVAAVPQSLRSRPEFLDQSQAMIEYAQSRFGQTSPLAARLSELQQNMVWQWSRGERCNIGDALFPGELRAHRYGADLFELEYQARFNEAEWLDFTQRAGVSIPPPKGVFRESLVISQVSDDVVRVQGATQGNYTADQVDALLGQVKSVYVIGPISDKMAKVVNRRGHLFVRDPYDVHLSEPKVADVQLIFVSAKDDAGLSRMFENPDVREVRAIEAQLSQFNREIATVVHDRRGLTAAIEKARVDGMEPVVVCHLTESAMLYDVPLMELLRAKTHILTCNLFRYSDPRFRTTGEIDYKATVQALLACTKTSGNSDGFFSTFALKYQDIMKAQGRLKSCLLVTAGLGVGGMLIMSYESLGGGGGGGDNPNQPPSDSSDRVGENAQSASAPTDQRSEDDDDRR